jgi:hypothetical protein
MARKRIATALLLISMVTGCQAITAPSKEGVTQAVYQIEDEMRRKAISTGNDSHFASKIEEIQALEPEITIRSDDLAHFSRQYTVFTKGSLLGINKYETGIRVSGVVTRGREGTWHATVTVVERTYDVAR